MIRGIHGLFYSSDPDATRAFFKCRSTATTSTGTVADLKSRGVEFTKDVEDHGYGLVTYFKAPGGITVQLYEPRYVKRKAAAPKPKAKAKPKTKPKAKTKKRR